MQSYEFTILCAGADGPCPAEVTFVVPSGAGPGHEARRRGWDRIPSSPEWLCPDCAAAERARRDEMLDRGWL